MCARAKRDFTKSAPTLLVATFSQIKKKITSFFYHSYFYTSTIITRRAINYIELETTIVYVLYFYYTIL